MKGLRHRFELPRALACAALLLLGATADAQPPEDVRSRLVVTPVLRGEFEQVKHLQGFRNPLRSRGHFVLAHGRGVIWETHEPFPSTVIATRDHVFAIEADGRREVLVEGSGAAGAGAINLLLLALIGGDLDALATRFELRETLLADGAWTLDLRPQAKELQRVLTRIELSGERHVREAKIEEAAGDRSEIRFLQLETEPAQLSADEAAHLE